MIDFPKPLLPDYLKLLEKRGVPVASFAECIKWCRYFLDYCVKYPASISQAAQLALFIEKLKAKKQTELQCRQAAYAVSAFITVQKQETSEKPPNEFAHDMPPMATVPSSVPPHVPARYGSQYSDAGYQEKSDSPEWDGVLTSMAAEIKVRHYSRKTLKTYQSENYHDVYALCAGQDSERAEEPIGFINSRDNGLTGFSTRQ